MPQVFRSAGPEAARIASRSPQMDAAARLVLEKARLVAAKHRLTGAYIRGLTVTEVRGRNGVRDRLVSATDPASVAIEFGHYPVRPRRTGTRRVTTGMLRWVPGQYIMTKARGML